MATGGFLASHLAIVATMKGVPPLRDRERELGYPLIIGLALRQLLQYFWLPKRFKLQPAHLAGLYARDAR